MSYNRNSYAGKIGDLGEDIVKKALERQGYEVTKITDEFVGSDASTVDFKVTQNGVLMFYAEVKTIHAGNFAPNTKNVPCYWLPTNCVKAYINFAVRTGEDVRLYVVDCEDGLIHYRSLHELEKPYPSEFGTFPRDKYGNYLGGDKHYYLREQFPVDNVLPIDDDDLEAYRELKANYAKSFKAYESLDVADLLMSPNETAIDILKHKRTNQLYVKAARLQSAIGYANSSVKKDSPLMKAADRLKLKWDRFNTQRLSGNDCYSTKAYYFKLVDVPKILAQYYEFNHRAKADSEQAQRNEAALKLREWFADTVIPKYAR